MGTVERRYCRDTAGQVWAVEIIDGHVVRGAGPLDPATATAEMLPHFPYDERSRCVSFCPDALNCPYAYRPDSNTA
jgi:hypothetical protein